MAVNGRLVLALLVAWLSGSCHLAGVAAEPPASAASAPSISAATALTDGVVESVDAGSGIVTIRHGEIANMQMPAMTMTFAAASKAMLDPIRTGDKVKFRVEMLANAPTITHIEKAPQ